MSADRTGVMYTQDTAAVSVSDGEGSMQESFMMKKPKNHKHQYITMSSLEDVSDADVESDLKEALSISSSGSGGQHSAT